jgi:hypothetical protein
MACLQFKVLWLVQHAGCSVLVTLPLLFYAQQPPPWLCCCEVAFMSAHDACQLQLSIGVECASFSIAP